MNVWSAFRSLFSRDNARTVVTVTTVNANGTSVVTTDAGNSFVVVGDTVTAGARALIQQGRIIGTASSLPKYDVTVS